ncbi:MAG: class I SAM-dependent methyltransferase [Gaiellaceae bacterium]
MSRKAPPDAFGRSARDYELGRPAWPEHGVDFLIQELGLTAEAEVLDLAAGTGKLTRMLVPRVARVVAVEPDDSMRAVLEEVVPGAESLAGKAEEIPLPDDSVDAVFVGEAFHWFHGDRALAEIARVLRPGGGLALLWNEEPRDVDPPVPEAAERLVEQAFERGGEPGGPRYMSGVWREPFARSPFGPLNERRIPHEIEISRDVLVARVLSVSSIASLSDEERRELAKRLGELVPDQTFRCFFSSTSTGHA